MKCRGLPQADQAEAIRQYQAGRSAEDIAPQFNRSSGAIHALMRRRGITGGPYQRSPDYEPDFLRLRAEGLTSAQIADRLGVTVRTVEWWARRALKIGLTTRRPAPKGEGWTDGEIARLRRLWATMGPAEISRETGWTVNRIQAKARRLGLPRRGYPQARAAVVGRTFKRTVNKALTPEEKAQRRADAEAARKVAAETLWTPTPASRPFMSTTRGQCRWPLGARERLQACGDITEGLDSYCRHHRIIAGGERRDGYAAAPMAKRGRASVFDQGQRA